jgi:hypothetical protein
MLQESAFNAQDMLQASKTAQLAHQTVLTAQCHQDLPLAQPATVDIQSSPTDHVPLLVPTEPTDHQTDHAFMERI